MAYRLKLSEPVEAGIRRIAIEQIDKALGDLAGQGVDRHEGIHQARRRFKRIRALLRLVRPTLGNQFQTENAWFRDAGRRLSALRDTEAMLEALETLGNAQPGGIGTAELSQVKQALVERQERIMRDQAGLDGEETQVRKRLAEARERAAEWTVDDDGFAAVEPGLKQIYRRGRRAMAAAYRDPVPDNLHAWRKRVKDHLYHMQLLRPAWPEVIKARESQIRLLGDLLGDDHDLAVLQRTLAEETDLFGNPGDIESLVAVIDQRRAELEARARPLGLCIYAEKPREFACHLRRLWRAQTMAQREAEALAR